MLAIVSSDRCYISDLLDKLDYSKKQSPNKSEIYECTYKEHKFIILVTGYGKVNIASNLRYLCDTYKIKAIIVIGTAGSIQDGNDIFSAIIPISTLQFDVDFAPIGYLAGQIPKIEKALYKADEDLTECLKKSAMKTGVNYSLDVIASSDMYVSNYNLANSIRCEYNAGAVDCESGIVGQFCFVNGLSYASIKIISNFANNNSIKQYNLYDYESSLICQRILNKFLKEFYEA